MSKIRESKESLVTKINSLADQNAKLSHDAQIAIQRAAELEEKLKASRESLSWHGKRVEELEKEREDLHGQIADLDKDLAQTEARCAQLLNQQSHAEEELAKLRTTVRCLTLGLKGAAAALPD